MNLSDRCEFLNLFIQKVENWVFRINNKIYYPPAMEKDERYFGFKHENLIVFAYAELQSIGHVEKIVRVGSDKYRLTEIPEDRFTVILDAFFSSSPTEALTPEIFVEGQESKMPKFKLQARWEPPGDYIKELIEKRDFIMQQDWDLIRPQLVKIYEEKGVKPPHYVSQVLMRDVPETIH